MNKHKIINETVEYYNGNNPRAISTNGGCAYTLLDDAGNPTCCAVGRCLKRKFRNENWEHRYDHVANIDIDKFLLKKYTGHGHKFWSDLQFFHDRSPFWTTYNTLTPDGEEFVKHLHNKYK